VNREGNHKRSHKSVVSASSDAVRRVSVDQIKTREIEIPTRFASYSFDWVCFEINAVQRKAVASVLPDMLSWLRVGSMAAHVFIVPRVHGWLQTGIRLDETLCSFEGRASVRLTTAAESR
jgi:hypothetical protein